MNLKEYKDYQIKIKRGNGMISESMGYVFVDINFVP